MEIHNLPEAEELKGRVNMWFYRGQTTEVNIGVLQRMCSILTQNIARPSVTPGNLQVAGDVIQMLLMQLEGHEMETIKLSTKSEDCSFSITDNMRNIHKYRSLDTLAGNFVSVDTAGAMSTDSLGASQGQFSISTPDLDRYHEAIPTSKTPITTPLTSQNHTLQMAPKIVLTIATPSNLTPPADGPPALKREITWDLEARSASTPGITSSPISTLCGSLHDLDLENKADLVKILKGVKENVQNALKMLDAPLNKTWKIENVKPQKTESTIKSLKRPARHSLGGSIPIPRRSLLAAVMTPSPTGTAPKTPQTVIKAPQTVSARRRLPGSLVHPMIDTGIKPRMIARPASPFATGTLKANFPTGTNSKRKL